MNNIIIAILLSDVILIKIFEEILKNYRDELKFKIISDDEEISNYSVFITDGANLRKLNDRISDNRKILCIGEKNNFYDLSNENTEISYLKVPFKFSELKERAENLFTSLTMSKSKIK